MSDEIFNNLSKAVIEGDADMTIDLTNSAIKDGIPAEDILKKGLIPGIRIVGEFFNNGKYFLPELIVSGKAMQEAVDHLNPLFSKGRASDAGKFLIGTVKGDAHDIGKNLVIMMLKNNGWDVTDLGVDISPEQFCSAVKEGDFDVCGISALLTMTMPSAAETIKVLEEAGLRDKVKVMIGGAPVTQEYADQIGADAYGSDAWEAVTKAERLLKEMEK